MIVRSLDSWSTYVTIREKLTDRATPEVRVVFGDDYASTMSAWEARRLARKLKKYADLADPPKRRTR